MNKYTEFKESYEDEKGDAFEMQMMCVCVCVCVYIYR